MSGHDRKTLSLSVRQLAQRLDVAINFVHYWIRQGTIPARQVGTRGLWLIALTDKLLQDLTERVRASRNLQNRDSKTTQ